MSDLPDIELVPYDLDAIKEAEGHVAVLVPGDGKLDQMARRVNRLTKGALERFVASDVFGSLSEGNARELAWPSGMAAAGVIVVRLERRTSVETARNAGASIAAQANAGKVLVLAGSRPDLPEIALGAGLRAYRFDAHLTPTDKTPKTLAHIALMTAKPDHFGSRLDLVIARLSGVYFTRDLVNEPANVLTTQVFAERLRALADLGVSVSVLEEPELERLGMRALLGVGQGSESPSKVVVMEWRGGSKSVPVALVGKGVVFDTGGISLKPAAGMEEMTMDMGGAGTVAGVMKTLALRGAEAHVVGLVGLVENMPDGRAQRPGDVVRTMKGDTVEVINTDAEGRLVLADVLWHAQKAYKPRAIVDLATLTGAIVTALGHHNAGVFGNDDALAGAFLAAAANEGEGAWRMPLDAAYDKQLESRVADVKNSGGRTAGAVTAARFLSRFIDGDTPWLHLDIAGVALASSGTRLSPKGATGWGVLALDRMIHDRYED